MQKTVESDVAIDLSGKHIKINNLEDQDFIDKYDFKCPLGIKGRKSHNKLYEEKDRDGV